MSSLRIIAAAVLSALLFMGFAMIEERETFGAFVASLTGLPVKTPAPGGADGKVSPVDPKRAPDRYMIYTAVHDYNQALLVAGRDGVLDLLDKIPATTPIIERTRMNARMSLNMDLPRPVANFTMRLMDVFYLGDSASAVVIEDWIYGNAKNAPTQFRITMRYSMIKSGEVWIITDYSPDKPFEVKQ